MLHQRDKKGQVVGIDPFFIERQDEIAALGGEQEIRILDPFGDPLAGQHLADVVTRDESPQLVVALSLGLVALLRTVAPEELPAS